MSFGGDFAALGRPSGWRRNTIAYLSGPEPQIEGDPVHSSLHSTKDPRRKRSKSVTFSSVDIISNSPPPSLRHEQERPSASSRQSHHRRPTGRRNTVASPVRLSHSHTTSSDAPQLPSHKPRRHTVATSPLPRPSDYTHPHPDKRSSDLPSRISYNYPIKYYERPRRSSHATSYGSDYAGLDSSNSQRTGLYVSGPTKFMPQQHPVDAVYSLVSGEAPYSSQERHFSSSEVQRFGFSPSRLFQPSFHSEEGKQRALIHQAHHTNKPNYIVRLLTSELATSFAANKGFETVMLVDAGVSRALPPIFTSPPPSRDGNIMVEKAPNKGLGMFARRAVYNGELILTEHPIFVTPYTVAPDTPVSRIYQQMFNLLSKPMRHSLLDLAASAFWGGAYIDENDVYESLTHIHTLGISLPDPKGGQGTHRAIFLNLGRCNHSCGPNARWFWDASSFSAVLIALRPINPGDEITIAYLSPHPPFYERRSSLLRHFSFDCICDQCLRVRNWTSADVKAESDRSREFLSRFWENQVSPSFEQWCQDPFHSDDILIRTHERALALIKREGLEVLSSAQQTPQSDLWPPIHPLPIRDVIRHMDCIAMCYGALGDTDNFLKWLKAAFAEREHDALDFIRPDMKEYQHAWDTQKLVFRKWVSNPKSLPVWGWRKTRWGGTQKVWQQ